MVNDKLYSQISFNAVLLVKEMRKRKIAVKIIPETEVLLASYKSHKELLYDIYSSNIFYPLGWIINDKFYSKKYLQRYSIPVPEGMVFPISSQTKALAYAEKIGFPIVLKPTVGSHGDLVYTHIDSRKELKKKIHAFRKDSLGNEYFLIEKHINGQEYRLFVTRDGILAAVQRVPANVVGDGNNSILMLIQKENHRRMNPRNTCLCEIRLDVITFDYMEKHEITLNQVPGRSEKVFLRGNSNVSTGGNCYDVTDNIHSSIQNLAGKVLSIFSNVPYIGIDLICPDIKKPLKTDTYAICELNSAPGLSLHMMPEKGKPRNVVGALVDLLFPETKV